MSDRTKADLAARLGIAEDALLPRSEAAALLGLDVHTLRTHPNDHVGFFRLSDARTARALYPKPWVEDYRSWRAGGRTSRFRGHMGPQSEWPSQRPISVRAAVLMIERWKYRELHIRCEDVCGGTIPFEELISRHRSEAAMLYRSDGTRKESDDPDLLPALVEKANAIIQPAGACVSPDRLAPLMRVVWEQVLETERGWLADAR